MNLFTESDLKMLIGTQSKYCVSLYMPTVKVGDQIQQNPIRFKNLLDKAENYLVAAGLRAPEAKELIMPAREYIKDTLFWKYQGEGLAVFISPEKFLFYHLPYSFKELVVVTNRYHLKPLLPLLGEQGLFYILALSQNEVKLFQSTHYSIQELELKGVPRNIDEAVLKFEDPEKHLECHTIPAREMGTGKRGAKFHNQGAGIDMKKDDIVRYFSYIDQGLRSLLKEKRAPLVLAMDEQFFPIYKEVNTYPYLVNGIIKGNPKLLKPEELRDRAWQITSPLFQQAEKEALALYEQLAGSERTSNNLKKIVPAAYNGKVELLFVAMDAQEWGKFDLETQEVLLHREEEPNDQDLLNFAAIYSLIHKGKVFTVEQKKMPGGTNIAAIFRY